MTLALKTQFQFEGKTFSNSFFRQLDFEKNLKNFFIIIQVSLNSHVLPKYM